MTMSQKTRILIVAGALVVLAIILAVVGFVSQSQTAQAPASTPQPGMIHLYVDGAFVANVSPADMKNLPAASFKDTEQGKDQGGWWLRDVIRLYVKESQLSPQSQITLTGTRQGAKTATVTWAQALDPANNIALDLAGDGQSVKLASTMAGLNTRDQWVQGVTQIDIQTKP
jgi:hypothetical protein